MNLFHSCFISVILLLCGASVPKIIKNRCFPVAVAHRLRTADAGLFIQTTMHGQDKGMGLVPLLLLGHRRDHTL